MEKRKSYNFEFKHMVIKFAEITSNRAAGRRYSVDESMVRRWRKTMKEVASDQPITAQSNRKRMKGGGRKPVLGKLEELLLERIIDACEKHNVTLKTIIVWAHEMARKNDFNDFCASRGWLLRFMKRSNLTMMERPVTNSCNTNNTL